MRWDHPYQLNKTQLQYDVLLVSNTGMGFAPGIEHTAPLGGSELEACLLLEELAKLNLKVGSVNPIGSAVKSKNVDNWSLNDLKIVDIKTKILINLRGIPPPQGIAFQRVIHWLTDNIQSDAPYFMENLPPELNQRTVAVSDFHLHQMKLSWNPSRIYNMVPDFIYNAPKVKKDPNLFLYASSAMKGLPETLKLWKELSNNYAIKKSKLLVCSPGYDRPDMEELKKIKNVEFIGALKIQDLIGAMLRCNGLFYVNRMPETFGLVAAFAEAVGCVPHALCLNGFGGLKEVVNTPTVVDDVKLFSQNLIDYNNGKLKCLSPKNFKPSIIIPQWVSLLESVAQ